MAGSSVGAMVVGTVFIMVFGMATVTMVESIDDSVKNSDYKLSEPEVVLVSVTDKQESTGPVNAANANDDGSGYSDGDSGCATTGGTGTGLIVQVDTTGDAVTMVNVEDSGNGYTVGGVITISGCGNGDATFQVGSIHDQNTITISNTGSETVDLSHIFVTFSDTATKTQGNPFVPFVSHYTGPNLYLFPGEQLSTDAFPLDSNTHGFAISTDPNRAFLAIYDYNDAETVTIT